MIINGYNGWERLADEVRPGNMNGIKIFSEILNTQFILLLFMFWCPVLSFVLISIGIFIYHYRILIINLYNWWERLADGMGPGNMRVI